MSSLSRGYSGRLRTDAVPGTPRSDSTINYKSILFELDRQIGRKDLEAMLFLCVDHFPSGDLETIDRPLKLFEKMEQQQRIILKSGGMQYLAEMLFFIHRIDLLKKLGFIPHQFRQEMQRKTDFLINPFRVLLLKIYDDVDQKEFGTLKYFAESAIGRSKTDKIKNALDLFIALEQAGVLGYDHLDFLLEMLVTIDRLDLTALVDRYIDNYLPREIQQGEIQQPSHVSLPPLEHSGTSKEALPANGPFHKNLGDLIGGSTQMKSTHLYEPSNVLNRQRPQVSTSMQEKGPHGRPLSAEAQGEKEKFETFQQVEGSYGEEPSENDDSLATGGVPSVVGLFRSNSQESDDDEIVNTVQEMQCTRIVEAEQAEDDQVKLQLAEQNKRLREHEERVEEENRQRMEDEKNLPCYKMDRKPRGVCLIINNEKFIECEGGIRLPDRDGTDVDVARLTKTFRKLHFKVTTYKDLTAEQMIKVLVHFAMTQDHTQFDCFVCCILSHGESGKVFGIDGVGVEIATMTGYFRPLSAPALKGKPKLFFLQACQGKSRQDIVDIQTDEPVYPIEERHTIPNEADFLIGYATVPGYVSYRSRSKGSWYITKLTEHLDKHGERYDLLSILTNVNLDLASSQAKIGGASELYGQVPAPQTTLRKRVIFNK